MKLSEHISILCRSVKLLLTLGKRYWICVVCGTIITSAIPYVPIWFSARLIDALVTGEPLRVLITYAALTVGIVFLLSLVNTYIGAQRSIYGASIYRNQDWLYSEKAMQMAYASIESKDITALRERIKVESQTGYHLGFLDMHSKKLIQYSTQILLSLSMTLSFFLMDTVSMWLKLVFLLGVLCTVTVNIITSAKGEKLFTDFYDSCVDVNVKANKYYMYLSQYGSGKDIRLYGMRDGLAGYMAGVEAEVYQKEHHLQSKRALLNLADLVFHHGLQLGTYSLLVFAALRGNISVGSIAQYASSILLLLTAVSGLVSSVQTTLVNNGYLKRFFSYFDIPNDMYQGSLTVEKRDDNEYFVEFRDVSFRYPNTETYALRHVNFKFKVGEKLAIVGMNGSGKTTFIKLLCRLYDPTEGQILLNGVDIRKYDYDEYMSIFSVVFQDFQLFSLKLGQIVAAGSDFDEEKVRQCLQKANFWDRLAQLPEGVHTYLYKHFDKSGIEISGGEAQKIALARALYKDAPFIILDEPTAALDPVSEYEVYSNFNTIAGDKTAVYISHRLASCRFCDKIAVFDSGQIVQSGDHNSLLAQEGIYAQLWNAQAQYYVRP